MRVVFFGTPPFAAQTLRFLLEKGVEVVGVVTRPDKAVGRSDKLQAPAVKKLALQLCPELPLLQPKRASAPEVAEILRQLNADLFVVVAYGQIIKKVLLDMPQYGCINVHASLLPKYRGAAPIQRSIMEGEKETGVTIMHMAEGLDTGDIIETVKVSIGEQTHGELEASLCLVGCDALLKVIGNLENGTAVRREQQHEISTYAKKITPEDSLIVFERPAVELYNRIRGVTPRPGASCWIEVRGKRKRMKILEAKPLEQEGSIGEILSYGKDGWVVGCGVGALSLDRVQLEGNKPMASADFMRGFPKDALRFCL